MMRKADPYSVAFELAMDRSRKTIGQKISSHRGYITRYEERIKTIRASTSLTIEGVPKEDAILLSERDIRKQKASIISLEKKVKQIESQKDNIKEVLEKDPDFAKLESLDGYITFWTKPLKHQGKSIGSYRVDWDTKGDTLYATNMTHQVGNPASAYQHWAVNGTNMCFGEWSDDLTRAVTEGNVPMLFRLFIFFFTLSEDPHAYIKKDAFFHNLRKRNKTHADWIFKTPAKEFLEGRHKISGSDDIDIDEDDDEEDEDSF